MAEEIGLWRIDGHPREIATAMLPRESTLERIIEENPELLDTELLFVGRQVPTAQGKFVDLLAVDAEGALHVLELKRDKTPRDVVAQALDYGSWADGLSHGDVIDIFEQYRPGLAFEAAFSERFGGPPPEELNFAHRLTLVASEVDAATARIVEYLAKFDVPINVVFFRYFVDEGREYLARTWLVDDVRTSSSREGRKTREPWNGHDWYVSIGEGNGDGRSWDDARNYGFVSAGGGEWYSRTLRSVPVGARIFACIPGTGSGYVGVGEVIGAAAPFDDAVLETERGTRRLDDFALAGTYTHPPGDGDTGEYVLPVRWTKAVPREDAYWEKGLFANQNSACKLRNRFTIERVTQRFGVGD